MEISTSAERRIDAPAERVFEYLADYREHHPKILPSQFGPLEIERGGVGAGTVARFSITLGGRTTDYRVEVDVPEPGRVLTETDPARRTVTTFTVEPTADGGSVVRIDTSWVSDGIMGFVERLAAPQMLKGVYAQELENLDRYVRAGQTDAATAPSGSGTIPSGYPAT
jgi:uncharacterized protein YndB with AHSA1/START domain